MRLGETLEIFLHLIPYILSLQSLHDLRKNSSGFYISGAEKQELVVPVLSRLSMNFLPIFNDPKNI